MRIWLVYAGIYVLGLITGILVHWYVTRRENKVSGLDGRYIGQRNKKGDWG